MQTILGAGGIIGKELAKELKNYTDTIRLVSRNPVKVNQDDLLFNADLTDKNKVLQAVEGSDVVYLCPGFAYSAKIWQKPLPCSVILMTLIIRYGICRQQKIR
jgi:uncharacterized protein YbjT (DUF2867 family)